MRRRSTTRLLRLVKELRHLRHRQEEPERAGLEGQETEMPVKARSRLVLRIDDDRHRADVARTFQATAQGIDEK